MKLTKESNELMSIFIKNKCLLSSQTKKTDAILKIIYEKLFPNIFLLRYGKKIIFKTKEKKFIKRYIYAIPSKL
jgi:hypothetical protein